MSRALSFVLLLLIIIPATAQASYDGNSDGNENQRATEIREFQVQVNKIKKDADYILESFEVFDLDMINDNYNVLNENLVEMNQSLSGLRADELLQIDDDFYTLYNTTLKSYSSLTRLYDFYLAIEDKKESWSSQYFRKWETTYALRTRIDQLYVKEEKMNMHYAGMKDYKIESVRKRNIYESCTAIYNTDLMQLKGTGDCDHYQRIQILNELIPVLRKCEKLAYNDKTRSLEKQLKQIDAPEDKAKAILEFTIE